MADIRGGFDIPLPANVPGVEVDDELEPEELEADDLELEDEEVLKAVDADIDEDDDF